MEQSGVGASDLSQLFCCLKHCDFGAGFAQCDGGGKATDSGTNNSNVYISPDLHAGEYCCGYRGCWRLTILLWLLYKCSCAIDGNPGLKETVCD